MPMTTQAELQTYLDSATVSKEVFALRPDYRAVLIAISGITPGPSDDQSEALLQDAESSAREQLSHGTVSDIPHVAAWRDAYKSFGAKPAKFRNSLEALTRRVANGLPRVNRLTDMYNAVSVRYQIPLGGEDLDGYVGPPRLVRAKGDEAFEIREKGELVSERPEAGEVVWVDDVGVTCRRWNWRQGPRTALRDETERVLFICDALGVMSDEKLEEAIEVLIGEMRKLGDDVKVAKRVITASEGV